MEDGGYIFISHSHKDIKQVRELRNYMEAEGFDPLCFYLKCLTDEDEIDGLIKREIDSRDWFVYVDSPNARQSKWVKKERMYIESQQDHHNKIVTIDLTTKIRLEEFSRKLLNSMRVYLMHSDTDIETAIKLRDKLVKDDYKVFLMDLNNADLEGSIKECSETGCLALMVSPKSAKEIAGILESYSSNERIFVVLLFLYNSPKGKQNLKRKATRSFDSLKAHEYPWVNMNRWPSTIQLDRAVERIEELLISKYNETEDKKKLETNFERLREIYSGELLVYGGNTDVQSAEEDAVIPEVKVADLTGKEIVVRDETTCYKLPDFVVAHKQELMQAHAGSSVYDNVNIRVKNWYWENNTFVIETQRTTYFNSLLTNRAMDFHLADGTTVRKALEPGKRLKPLEKSLLSNHLGFNGMIESSDGWFFFILRKGKVSIEKRSYGNSIQASMKAKYALDSETGAFNVQGIYKAIKKEIEDEIGIGDESFLTKKELEAESKCQPVITCAYRELVEGGKPQLFFYYKSVLSRTRIVECFTKRVSTTKKEQKNEPEREGIIRTVLTDGERMVWVKKETLLDENNTHVFLDRIETIEYDENGDCRRVTLPVYPGPAACVVFLKDYLLSNTL